MLAKAPPDNFTLKRQSPAYRQTASLLREQILSQKIAPGAVLPPTKELAVQWESSYFTIHTALKLLEKEGLLDRVHGARTIVRKTETNFACCGIYFSGEIWRTESSFYRIVCHFLQKRLGEEGIRTEVFIDSRPYERQTTVLPSLKRAIELNEIQAVIAPLSNPMESVTMRKLRIPLVHISTTGPPRTRVDFDHRQLWNGMFSTLAGKGCRSVGVIMNYPKTDVGSYGRACRRQWNLVREEMRSAGLLLREDWLIGSELQPEAFFDLGYHSFARLWRNPNRPDGLAVFPDLAAEGVIHAILRHGIRVPKALKCAFHRNAHMDIHCPFPVTWAISDEEEVANEMIRNVQAQFAGNVPEAKRIPHRFEEYLGMPDEP